MKDISHIGQGDAIMNNPYVPSVRKQRLSANEQQQKNDYTKEVKGLLGYWNLVTQHSYFCCQVVNLQFPFHTWHSNQVHIKLQSRYKAEKMIQKFPRDDVFEARKIVNFLRLVLWTYRELWVNLPFRGQNLAWSKTAVVVDARPGYLSEARVIMCTALTLFFVF